MKIPCATHIPFVVSGLSFLQAELTASQFQNLTMIATALILGAKFNLSEIRRMWLREKAVSTLSYFLSDAKFCTSKMQHLYALQVLDLYKIKTGYFIIDDTMKHHTKFCRWIHGVFVLFDHAIGTNLKATCIVFLYYTDGDAIKFPITFRIFYQDTDKMKWIGRKKVEHRKKYLLASDMLQWALEQGFPRCTVLADAWFGIDQFIRELKRLKLDYILEIRSNLSIKKPCETPKLTPKGRLAKNQYDVIKLPEYFKSILDITKCGLEADLETGKREKILYHAKIVTAQLNSTPGKHRIVESTDPVNQTTKYYLSNYLHWESTKILSEYCHRWVIEEFFKNAKQLSDMEGATIRSEQGVAITLCLVSWIDSLLHYENYKQSTAGKLSKGPLTIPSIIRRAQHENLTAVFERVKREDDFLQKWLEVEEKNIFRQRKPKKQLVTLEQSQEHRAKKAA